MKKIILSFSFFLALVNCLYSQINQDWKWQHPYPQGNIIRYVNAFDSQNWVFVAESGTFIKTTNGGSNFTVYTNAGTPYLPGNGQSKPLYNGWFFDSNTGMVCGFLGYFARTTNGGQTWDTTISTGATSNLYGIHFINNNTGYMCGSNAKLLKTTNSGLSWTSVAVTGFTTTMYNVYALDTNYIYTSLSNGRCGFTTNAGITWNYPSSSFGLNFAQDINFINPNTGFICGNDGKVYYSTNGGFNWVANPTPGTNTLYHIFTESISNNTQPYFEGFEHPTLFPPDGWTNYNVAGNVAWMRSYWYHTGTQSAICAFQNPGPGEDWLITPQWSIVAGDSLVFWMRAFLSGSNPDSLCIRVSTTDLNISSFTSRILYLDQNVYPPIPNWQRYAVSLAPFAGQSIYIAFKHGDNNGQGILVDDVSIERYAPTTNIYITGDPHNIYRRTLTDTAWISIPITGQTQTWTSQYFSSSKSGNIWVAAGGHGLINVSTNAGQNWSDKTFLISTGNRNDIWGESSLGKAISVGFPSIAGTSYDQVMITTNGGTNWSLAGINSSAVFRSISMINSNTGFICGSNGEIQKTTNGGFNWNPVVSVIPSTENLYSINFIDANTGWVFSNSYNFLGTVWKTTNGGINWVQSQLSSDSTRITGAYMVNANTGWVISNLPALTPRPYKTTNGGITWTRQDNLSGTWPAVLNSIFMLDANIGYIAGGNSISYLLKTTNGGSNWETVNLPYLTTYNDVHFINTNLGMVTGITGLVALTTNGGINWNAQNVNDGSVNACWLFGNGNSYAVGSGQTFPHAAIFKNSNVISGSITYNYSNPIHYSLSQNYPNPFNPATFFKFSISNPEKVSLEVYDITGRVISKIIDDVYLNKGEFEVRFDGSNLSSGVYYYRLQAGTYTDIKRMMLIK